jgi:hypothetical protein
VLSPAKLPPQPPVTPNFSHAVEKYAISSIVKSVPTEDRNLSAGQLECRAPRGHAELEPQAHRVHLVNGGFEAQHAAG